MYKRTDGMDKRPSENIMLPTSLEGWRHKIKKKLMNRDSKKCEPEKTVVTEMQSAGSRPFYTYYTGVEADTAT